MRKSSWLPGLLLLAFAVTMAFGVWRLLVLRFQAGDIYPAYSSLRADPLGTKVLHDALERLPGVSVSRNFRPLEKIQNPASTTIFLAGASADTWEADEAGDLQKLADGGARVIVAFLPLEEGPKAKPGASKKVAKAKSPKPKKKTGGDNDKKEEVELADLQDVGKTLQFGIGYMPRSNEREVDSLISGIEPQLSWHSILYFSKQSTRWRVIYDYKDRPVMMECNCGKGSLVVASDCYFLSNEAMRAQRTPLLLTWLTGSSATVIFDERHLGIAENPGIASLVFKYRLQGLVAAVLALAALFVWQTAIPFLPPRDQEEPGVVAGKDSASGFVSLLRRGIAPPDLIRVCVEQWKKSFGHNAPRLGLAVQRMDGVVLAQGRDPAAAFRAISQILSEKK